MKMNSTLNTQHLHIPYSHLLLLPFWPQNNSFGSQLFNGFQNAIRCPTHTNMHTFRHINSIIWSSSLAKEKFQFWYGFLYRLLSIFIEVVTLWRWNILYQLFDSLYLFRLHILINIWMMKWKRKWEWIESPYLSFFQMCIFVLNESPSFRLHFFHSRKAVDDYTFSLKGANILHMESFSSVFFSIRFTFLFCPGPRATF